MSKTKTVDNVSDAKQFTMFLLYVILTIIGVVAIGATIGLIVIWKYGETSVHAMLLQSFINYEPAQIIFTFIIILIGFIVAELNTGLINK